MFTTYSSEFFILSLVYLNLLRILFNPLYLATQNMFTWFFLLLADVLWYSHTFGVEYSSHNAPHLSADSSVSFLEIIKLFKRGGINTERKQTVMFTWTRTNSLQRELCNWCCTKGRLSSPQRRWVKTPWNIFSQVISFFWDSRISSVG
jgi:hypothetical protein